MQDRFWCRTCSRYRVLTLATDQFGKHYFLCIDCENPVEMTEDFNVEE